MTPKPLFILAGVFMLAAVVTLLVPIHRWFNQPMGTGVLSGFSLLFALAGLLKMVTAHGASRGLNSETTITAYQAAIIADASAKLGRELTDRERQFITAHGGFLALEAISETVRSEPKDFVE